MFRPDCDPTFFDSMNIEDNLSNNIGFDGFRDLDAIYSEDWIPAPGDIEIFRDLSQSLFEGDEMEIKETDSALSPIPAPPSPVVVVEQEETDKVKLEKKEFDLVKYIIFGEDADLLTPVEEKSCPIFEIKPQQQEVVVIKSEPEPSTSSAPSPRRTSPVEQENTKPVRRRAPKRRYTTDSDYSIETTASSYNATKKSSKKRGRPAKELITNLPTVEDFRHMSKENACHLVLRIKNNEASRKSRMKSRSKQQKQEDECTRLSTRQDKLRGKKNRLDAEIEVLKGWLLGIN